MINDSERVIWNRACSSRAVARRSGDLALAAVIRFVGLTANGGLAHACEGLTAEELDAAENGYRYLGLDEAADLVAAARRLDWDSAENEPRFSRLEGRLDRLDGLTEQQFRTRLRERPDDFAPITDEEHEDERHENESLSRLLNRLD
ncbi:DMP19 family protein [Microlunatus parietis]|uniref:DNA mimic protein DMP19 C-terminal domain-containing protein n=1 Tax=Microlunatus parietis TaxID=682979 RepID=A0A7Y9I8G3_9ACTN|nr:hypothetical protein [Microlunatus parietis]NYE71948.1 hypothetical protein [Microlunatus parietis]